MPILITHEDGQDADGCNYASNLDLLELWGAFQPHVRDVASVRQDKFRQHLREMVRDPDAISELAFCDNCGAPSWTEDLSSTRGGSISICEPCWDEWSDCDNCGGRYPDDDLYETLSGSDVCRSCRESRYTYCEDCDGYYHDEDADDHDHDADSCCESPQQEFKVRNDGCEPLANDTRITITLPAGIISNEGLKAIRLYLQNSGLYDLSYDLPPLGDQWQTKTGNYAKRLSRHAYQHYQAKLTPQILSEVGCIARDNSTSVGVEIEVTRRLNQSAGNFYCESSCWWGGENESRCALKTNGGFGLRSFTGDYVSGRAWVLPLRQDGERGELVPTFDTLTPDAFVVFNGYGALSGYAAPRIVAHMAGLTYRKIGFECVPMYVNAGGYLVAREDLAEKYADSSLNLSVSQHARLFETEKEHFNA